MPPSAVLVNNHSENQKSKTIANVCNAFFSSIILLLSYFLSGMRKIDVFEGFVSACENCVSLQTGFGLQTDLLSWEGLVDCPTQLTLIFPFFS